eukprot:CAMPEP_0171060308 /NCGR_PEP_ID=MMETSP0766_2-20121228/3751_1 /TAXON_ID=439317 /ORGANISM="Gambierdiscus australes, Strain CAWD 149" /LENGTH=234 /DNA_ID=CAMNT_0011515867 /DNA_START=28 /DNA_END=732 /DNA_ORIENTATION=-
MALVGLLCLLLQPSTAVLLRTEHQPKAVLAAADALWGETVPDDVPHAVVDDLDLFSKLAAAVKAKLVEPTAPAELSEPPEVVLYWRTRGLENGTKGSMKMDHGCNGTGDGGTVCAVNLRELDRPMHIRLWTARSLREGDALVVNVQAEMATGDKQELKFTCPACSFPCKIPFPGSQVLVQMPPCPILAGVYDVSMPLGMVPFVNTVRSITASTFAVHADGRGAFNMVSFLKVKS